MVVADTSSLISLGETNNIKLIKKIFGELRVAQAVWNELLSYNNPNFNKKWLRLLKPLVLEINSENHLISRMDYGESESVILYVELFAEYLLIDDQKARENSRIIKCQLYRLNWLVNRSQKKRIFKGIKTNFY